MNNEIESLDFRLFYIITLPFFICDYCHIKYIKAKVRRDQKTAIKQTDFSCTFIWNWTVDSFIRLVHFTVLWLRNMSLPNYPMMSHLTVPYFIYTPFILWDAAAAVGACLLAVSFPTELPAWADHMPQLTPEWGTLLVLLSESSLMNSCWLIRAVSMIWSISPIANRPLELGVTVSYVIVDGQSGHLLRR